MILNQLAVNHANTDIIWFANNSSTVARWSVAEQLDRQLSLDHTKKLSCNQTELKYYTTRPTNIYYYYYYDRRHRRHRQCKKQTC